MKRIWSVGLLLVTVAGCGGGGGGGSSEATSYASAQEIAEALEAAGVTCDDFERNAEPSESLSEDLPAALEEGDCTDAEHDIDISIYASEADTKRATGQSAFLTYCLFSEGFGIDIDGAEIAVGANWVVGSSDPDGDTRDAEPYADALGGEVKTIECP